MARYSKDHSRRSISIGGAISSSSPLENANTTPANNGTVTGAGDEFAYVAGVGKAYSYPPNITWDVRVRGSGSFTSFTVNFQASTNGSDWDTIDTSTNVNGESRTVQNQAYSFFRGNIGALVVSSGSPSIEVGISI